MEPVSSSKEGLTLVCQTCGDEGFTNAFVYCVKCLDAVIHRYCLNVMPKTFDELVIWYCEHCKLKSSRSYKKEVANNAEYVKPNKIQKKEGDDIHCVPNNKTCINENENEKGNIIQERKSRFEKDRKLVAWLLKQRKLLDEPQPPVQNNDYKYAQPVLNPIWRGCFSIVNSKYDEYEYEGFVGHSSNKACNQVFQEAKILPPLLNLQMQPKNLLWPKSFQECEPSDDKIALYFFPGDLRKEIAYDHLVLYMMNKEFAMKAVTKNAELLIFTSILLPPLFHKFQGDYYLWGVFRAKTNNPKTIDPQNELTGTKIFDCQSPRSPLAERKLHAQKRVPLIFETPIKRAIYVGPEIINCFTRIGWGGVLDFEADEVYPNAVIEWISSLEKTGTTFENIRLTGQVNGQKATLDLKYIRETFNVDTGICTHPEAQYEYPSEERLLGKGEKNIKLWEEMADVVFTPVKEGSLKRKLSPLAKALWWIGMRNIHPRVEDVKVVRRHEVAIIYGLVSGNFVVSYAHIVMMNIWRAFVDKKKTVIPHAYLISRFLKLKNVVLRNMVPRVIEEDTEHIARLNYASLVCNQQREEE